jgi:DNA replication ATP-dependent helicase Dna2
MVLDPRYGQLLLHNYVRLAQTSFPSAVQKHAALFQALSSLIEEVTDASGLSFFTQFTRIAYLGSLHKLPGRLLYALHYLRKNRDAWMASGEDHTALLLWTGIDLIQAVYQVRLPADLAMDLPPYTSLTSGQSDIKQRMSLVKGAITLIDRDRNSLHFLPEEGTDEVVALYNVTGQNDQFNESLHLLESFIPLPAGCTLMDVTVDEQGYWIPGGFVLLPDFLLDVSAVAEAAANPHAPWLSYLLRKYLPAGQSRSILLGNVANHFLDELIQHPDLTFRDACADLFKKYPLLFARMSDAELRQFLTDLKPHYLTILKMVKEEFPKWNIHPANTLVEPSFYAVECGLQGRLDLFSQQSGHTTIVELKSGKPFRPNKYGLSDAHYLQTLLYDLLIQTVYPDAKKSTAYILYSSEFEHPLRYAPVIRSQQMEALEVRNQLIGLEFRLCALRDTTPLDSGLFNAIRVEDFPGMYGFLLRDLMEFEGVYRQLDDLEKKYFQGLAGMIAREQRLAKIGRAGREGQEGQAALWQKGNQDKEEAFEILQHLQIEVNESMLEDPMLRLKRTEYTNELANFRTGDIVVLYPAISGKAPERDQLVKCSIASMDETGLWLRLRARQSNSQFFGQYAYWNLEADWLDSSFLGVSRSLFEWASAPASVRKRVLGLEPPAYPSEVDVIPFPDDLTDKQKEVCAQIIRASDIALLWGPPGTGKTSKVLHHVIRHLLENTNERMLVLAYTNRAVDEICEALEAIALKEAREYIRIGSRFGTAPAYQGRLLDALARHCDGRNGLLNILQSTRVVTGTVASIQGKPELFSLMAFDRLIVDEASQILEPSMAGLMARFSKCLLIGDHLQLPAVVVQTEKETLWQDGALCAEGFMNMRESLFERLLRQYSSKGWHWACIQLSQQGRMHQDIMSFPNTHFYGGLLQILPHSGNDSFQTARIPVSDVSPPDFQLPEELATKRVAFLPVEQEPEVLGGRINEDEAGLMVRLVQYFHARYAGSAPTIGVIAPFRAQIAAIRQALLKEGISISGIQIDTVERFQGGARDIILVSLSVKNSHQLGQLISLSSDGVDRKLNVALTRARQHLILAGNPTVLKESELYSAFMKTYGIQVNLDSGDVQHLV